MKLPILYEPEAKEYYLIELQGTIEFLDSNSKQLGQLEWNSDSNPILTIGHHKLKGKMEVLKKPFGVLVKNNEQTRSYTLSTVITKKCIFKTRPEHQLSEKFTGLHHFTKKR